nr:MULTISPECIES: DMT family transporter [unclassified Psychrosphaera]
MFVGFAGVVVLSSHKLTHGVNAEVFAILAVVTATCLYGISANYSKRFLQGVPPLLVASSTMACSAIIMLPVLLSSSLEWSSVSSNAWLAITCLGVFSTGIAYVLFYRLIENTGPTKAMMVTYLIPIFGVVFGNVFLDEQLFINMLFGGLLILLGVMLTTGLIKPRK